MPKIADKKIAATENTCASDDPRLNRKSGGGTASAVCGKARMQRREKGMRERRRLNILVVI
ncbi:MAG: hypothetical protein WC604_01870 [Candidatus Gracilibacteria bacterium]